MDIIKFATKDAQHWAIKADMTPLEAVRTRDYPLLRHEIILVLIRLDIDPEDSVIDYCRPDSDEAVEAFDDRDLRMRG